MSDDSLRHRQLTRRALILGGIKATLVAGAAGRLFYLQVLQSDKYKTLAEDNRINLKLVPASRGLILDRYGQLLAVNSQSFHVEFVSARCPNVPATLKRLSQLLNMTVEEEDALFKRVGRRKHYLPFIVRDNIDWAMVTQLELATLDLPGAAVVSGDMRTYPLSAAAAHITGYVGTVSEEEKDPNDPVLMVPGFRLGKTGLEKIHDRPLRGTPTAVQLEVNAHGRVVRELSRQEGQAGQDITLNIDASLQEFAYRRLSQERSAAAVVVHAHTGAIHALASFPAYDPDVLTQGITSEEWARLSKDVSTPLLNKAITGQYAPGSTFKPIVALAGLNSGAISPGHQHICSGHTTLGDHRFHCWKREGHGRMDIVSALEQSCDVFFYDVAQRTGIDIIAAMARRFGLGNTLNIDLPGEKPGLIPTQAWKKSRFKERWQQGETLVAGIGQGYMLATPLQLAIMAARLVNGGRIMGPRLTDNLSVENVGESLGLDPRHLALVLKGLEAVTQSRNGTARASRTFQRGWEMGGKTGTAQVRRITMAERIKGVIDNKDLAWESRDHALFIGYAPLVDPQFACAVVVEHGGGGSSIAAPIARDLLKQCYRAK